MASRAQWKGVPLTPQGTNPRTGQLEMDASERPLAVVSVGLGLSEVQDMLSVAADIFNASSFPFTLECLFLALSMAKLNSRFVLCRTSWRTL